MINGNLCKFRFCIELKKKTNKDKIKRIYLTDRKLIMFYSCTLVLFNIKTYLRVADL